MTAQQFWSCTPHRLHSYIEAYEMKEKYKDRDFWLLGGYFYQACLAAVSHNLEGRKSKVTYFEKPLSQMESEKKYEDGSELPEEEKERLRQQLVNNLKAMEASHNAFVKQTAR
jgi:hypothetical protein